MGSNESNGMKKMGGSIVIVVPQKRTLDALFHGESIYKWMMTGGTPISGNLHIDVDVDAGAGVCIYIYM